MYLKIKVIPDAKKAKIEKVKEDEYRIWVTVPAENNAANIQMLTALRILYPGTSVRIISGHHSPSKIISIN